MLSFSLQKIFLICVLALLAPVNVFCQQNPAPPQKPKQKVQRYILPPDPKEKFRFPTNKDAKNTAALKAYRKRVIEEQKQKAQRLNEERYLRFQENYNQVQNRAKNVRKPQKQKVFIAPPKPTLEQIARKKRLLLNKEILEGKKPPIAQDDPYYVEFIEEIKRLTFGKGKGT